MKTVKFLTLGCKVNQYDTQVIREQFLNSGFQELDNHLPADIYVINTCTVTQKADADSFSLIRRAKRENPNAKIIVTGCLTELDEDKIKAIGDVALIFKNKDKKNILNEFIRANSPFNSWEFVSKGISYFKGHTRAFLKIQDGCDNFCSYCKVALVRGSSKSKPLNDIIKEAEGLVKNGFKEIVLTGICLGSYGRDLEPKLDLVSVIEALENIDGLFRIRLSSLEALDVSEALIHKVAESKKLCRHLHIPLQSGDDEILKMMHRDYGSGDFLNLIQRIKDSIPEIAITTDVLIGFPGETEINFQNTLNLIKAIRPLKVHIFPYSPRIGTLAFNFKDKVSPQIINIRISQLKDTAQDCSFRYRRQFLNKVRDVLIEDGCRENPAFWQGYTDNYLKVIIASRQNLKNQLIPLRLKQIINNSLQADFC